MKKGGVSFEVFCKELCAILGLDETPNGPSRDSEVLPVPVFHFAPLFLSDMQNYHRHGMIHSHHVLVAGACINVGRSVRLQFRGANIRTSRAKCVDSLNRLRKYQMCNLIPSDRGPGCDVEHRLFPEDISHPQVFIRSFLGTTD